MSSNVGLSTPRGSGTSGYVQRNLSSLKPRDNSSSYAGQPYPPRDSLPRQRKPDADILAHDRAREIEIQVFELRDRLEDAAGDEKDDDEIDKQCDALREKLMAKSKQQGGNAGGTGKEKKNLKMYQVHEMAESKERESERLRKALGLKSGEGDGGEHPMARQERRRVEEMVRRGEREEEDKEGAGKT